MGWSPYLHSTSTIPVLVLLRQTFFCLRCCLIRSKRGRELTILNTQDVIIITATTTPTRLRHRTTANHQVWANKMAALRCALEKMIKSCLCVCRSSKHVVLVTDRGFNSNKSEQHHRANIAPFAAKIRLQNNPKFRNVKWILSWAVVVA